MSAMEGCAAEGITFLPLVVDILAPCSDTINRLGQQVGREESLVLTIRTTLVCLVERGGCAKVAPEALR